MAFKKRLECRVFIGYGLVAYTKLLLFLHPYGTTGECASGGAKKEKEIMERGTLFVFLLIVYIYCATHSRCYCVRGGG